ncbi:hypothetical protein D3C72_1953820 [compost metagenome]
MAAIAGGVLGELFEAFDLAKATRFRLLTIPLDAEVDALPVLTGWGLANGAWRVGQGLDLHDEAAGLSSP